MKQQPILLDCTMRDGGYYNNWNFSEKLINQYLFAMAEAGVDIVELGMRSLENNSFKGASAFTTDDFIRSLYVPSSLKVGVMVNASELVGRAPQEEVLQRLFPLDAEHSPVQLVRIASHLNEFAAALPVVNWLKERGFMVGFNVMQIASCKQQEVKEIAKLAANYEIDSLYFADSMGSLTPNQTDEIISWLRTGWNGALGIHTHDNLGLALSNTLRALDRGVTWLDATVTGMGRGSGNARTEELVIEIAERYKQHINMVPLMQVLESYFKPMQHKFGWGSNPYYYLAGKYNIHPSYVQSMLADSRFSEEDILSVINYLREEGGEKFSSITLDSARNFYQGEAKGSWNPAQVFADREVLVLGAGPSVSEHSKAIERFILMYKPIVLALNTQSSLPPELIDYRIACHPVRLLADCKAHILLPQPLITPFSMLPKQVQASFKDKDILDFGLSVQPGKFEVFDTCCHISTSLVLAYALAVVTGGDASHIYVAGFDGFDVDDLRTKEIEDLFKQYINKENSKPIVSLTDTVYSIPSKSIYAM